MSDSSVCLDIDDEIATITLNEPERRNALSEAIYEGLVTRLDEIETRGARAVIVQGSGGAFSAGGDVERMVDGVTSDTPLDDRVRTLERTTCKTLRRLYRFPVPTIAKIDGPAVGAGANLAIACDMQIASESASFGFVFRQVGLGVDAGTSYLLPRLVGANVAKELVMTGEIVDAERAHEIGLVNHVYPAAELDDEVDALAERIASGPTVALRHSKRLLNEGFEKSFEQAMSDEAIAQGMAYQTRDHEEGVMAFTDARDPVFEGE